MDRDHDERANENDIDQLVKKAFGMDDDQLLRDFLLAQTEIKDSQIPPEPEDGFKRLLGKIEKRVIHYVWLDGKSQAFSTQTEALLLKKYPGRCN